MITNTDHTRPSDEHLRDPYSQLQQSLTAQTAFSRHSRVCVCVCVLVDLTLRLQNWKSMGHFPSGDLCKKKKKNHMRNYMKIYNQSSWLNLC